MSTNYKPSPLSYGSPSRSSPFRRPESPASPSPLRNSTTAPLPSKQDSTTPSKLFSNDYASAAPRTPPSASDSWTPRGLVATIRDPPTSPTRGANSNPQNNSMVGQPTKAIHSTRNMSTTVGNSNALAQLKPGQVRELREGFQILDRDSDGLVGREDVIDMLAQLGRHITIFTLQC